MDEKAEVFIIAMKFVDLLEKIIRMIFLSHNYQDKGIVEYIALGLKEKYGQESIFYDSWAIRPGDGIIDKMNIGLNEAKNFFFFISKNSLISEMVKMEWQNALFIAAKGHLKFIPVLLDDSLVPPIIAQKLYIDFYNLGMAETLNQIYTAIDEQSSFTESKETFENLEVFVNKDIINNSIQLEVNALQHVELNPTFLFFLNIEREFTFIEADDATYNHRHINNATKIDGENIHAQIVKLPSSIKPRRPYNFTIKSKNNQPFELRRLAIQVNAQKQNNGETLNIGRDLELKMR